MTTRQIITSFPPGSLRKARRYRMRLAWSVWAVAAVFVLFQFFLQLSSGEIISGLMKSFQLSAFGGGLLASSYYYIYVLLQIPAGMLMDRYGPREILSLAALCVCIGCLLFATAKTALIALLARIVMGAGSAFAFVGCLNVISIWFPAKRFALMAAIVETAGMIGAIVGNFWLAHFIEVTGWRDCLLFASGFAGILSIFLWAIVRNSAKRKKIRKVEVAFSNLWNGLKGLMKNPIVWINGVYSGLMFSIVTVFIALWGIPFLEFAHHIDLVKATLVASTLYGGVAIGGPILGWLDSHTHFRRIIMVCNGIFSTLFLSLVIFDLNLSLEMVALLLFLTGICASSYVLTFAIVNEIATPSARATGIGFTNMLCVCFAPVLQPFVGFLLTKFDGPHLGELRSVHAIEHFQWAVGLVPALLLMAIIIGFYLPKRR